MNSPLHTNAVSRRRLLGYLGLGAGTLGLAACGGSGGAGGTAAGSGGVLTGAELAAEVEASVPNSSLEFLVEPDFPSVNGSTPGYVTMPDPLVDGVSEVPGSGGSYTVMSPAWWTSPPGLGDNAYYEAVNEELGATLEFQVADGNSYADKVQTVLASPKNVPDWMVIPSWNIPPRFVEGVGNVFQDLTDHLAGEGILDYPNLARLDPAAWEYSMFNGRIYGLPYPSELVTDAVFYRRDLFEELGVEPPTDAESFLEVLSEITDPGANRWGCENLWNTAQLMYALPPTFAERDGELVHRFEMEEFKEAIIWLTKVIESGAMHPDAVAGNDGAAKDRFESGQTLVMNDGVGGWHEALARVRPSNPDFDQMAMDLFAPDGGAPTLYRGAPVNIFSFLKKTDDEDQVREMLRIADWCASQFGTKEFDLLTYGVEGTHFERDEHGIPQLNDQGRSEVTSTYQFLAQPAIVNAKVQFPDYVEASSEWMARQSEHVVDPLFYGIQIQEPAEFGSLGQPLDDLVVDISRGRKDISELDAAVENWRTSGGDKLREFYGEFMA